MPQSPYVRNIALDLIITILTCGLFNFYVQYQQILALNEMLKTPKYDFLKWLVLCIITCGLYHIYHEYRMSQDLAILLKKNNDQDSLIAVLLTFFGLSIVLDAIQQSDINAYYGKNHL